HQVQRGREVTQQQRHGHARVVEPYAAVQEPLPQGQAAASGPLAQQDLPDPVRPAPLLVEVVRPGGRAFTDGEDVGGVHAFPTPAGGRVHRRLHPHPGEVVLDDGVLVAVDLCPGGRPVKVVGADQQRRVHTVATTLHHTGEQVLLHRGAVGDPVV